MKLTALASPSETVLELHHPKTEELIGVKIHGYTTDSEEWRRQQKLASQRKKGGGKQKIYFEKDGTQSMEIDGADGASNRRAMLASVVTNITGFEDWEYSPEATLKLFNNPKYSWIVDQWGDWLDERSNFFGEPETD